MRTDKTVGVILGIGAVSVLVGATVFGSLPIVAFAVLIALGVLPISYKLLTQPPIKQVSLGAFTKKARRAKRGWTQRGAVFSFSGIDGSGKSSCARAVVDSFEDIGVEGTVEWGRWRPLVSYPFMGILYVFFHLRRKDYDQYSRLRQVWGYFVLLDMLAFSLVYVYPHLLRGRVVCIDRYILDTVVEMKYDNLYNDSVLRWFDRVLPTPDVSILLDVSVEESLRRKDDTKEMLENLGRDIETSNYLQARRKLYLDEESRFDAVVIDGNQSASSVQSEVVSTALDEYFEF